MSHADNIATIEEEYRDNMGREMPVKTTPSGRTSRSSSRNRASQHEVNSPRTLHVDSRNRYYSPKYFGADSSQWRSGDLFDERMRNPEVFEMRPTPNEKNDGML